MMRNTIILCLITILWNNIFGEELNCPKNDIHFEKILGVRPSDISKSKLLHKNDKQPVTIECIKKCEENIKCNSFILYYETLSCYWFEYLNEEIKENLIAENNVAWFIKTCLRVQDVNCDEKLWKIERIPGSILIGNDTKTLPGKVTRNECQQNCLNSKNFHCKSMKFKNEYLSPNGICTLSNADRFLLPNNFRAGRNDEEYIENQCAKNNERDDFNSFCAYEEYENVIFGNIDLMYENKMKNDCQKLCDDLKEFRCRGYSLLPTQENPTCLLHSENSKVYGTKMFHRIENAFYYEKARCLNISVTCTEEYMIVMYYPENKFYGRIYMKGYSDRPQCFVKGQGYEMLTLKLSLSSSECGIIEAVSLDQRRLLSASLLIQYNNLIQTQGDRLIKVGCIFQNDSKLIVGTGVTVAPDLTNNGSSLINNITSINQNNSNNPLVQMKIVDHLTGEEISDTQIGQRINLVIESTLEDNYDIWAGHLIAMTENGAESILLLDDKGCPTTPNVFPSLNKIKNNKKTYLVSTFEAFKFSSSPGVRFSIIVQVCQESCPQVDCNNQYRQKRESSELSNGSKIIKINRSDFENINSQSYKKALEIMVTVRTHRLSPDSLIYGNGKVVVAGYNYETNEVCVDYSLLIGIIVAWVLIQIIFAILCIFMVKRYKKRYKNEYERQMYEEYNKNFGYGVSNLDNRRVRWAESGDEM